MLAITLFIHKPLPCDADIADIAGLTVSGTMSNSSLLMPRADARIRIVHSTDNGIKVDMTCEFEVIPSETVNASLAFVYPSYWALYSGNYISIDFDITINDALLEHSIVNHTYLVSQGYILNSTELGGGWIESVEFVMFNYEMQVGNSYDIRVTTSANPMTSRHYASFSYIIGSAKTFQGQTHQTVEIHVVEEKKFYSFAFHPEEFLTESTNSSGTTAVWDLVIDQETNISQVGFSATINQYRPARPWPYDFLVIVIVAGSLSVISVSVIVVRQMKQQ